MLMVGCETRRTSESCHGSSAIQCPTLIAEGDDDADALAQRRLDLGLEDDLREVRRADLLLAFTDEHEVHGQLRARRLERMQCGETGDLRPLGVRRAASDDDLPDAGPV